MARRTPCRFASRGRSRPSGGGSGVGRSSNPLRLANSPQLQRYGPDIQMPLLAIDSHFLLQMQTKMPVGARAWEG